MINRLRALPWGWITIGFAYTVAALPLGDHLLVRWVTVIAAYIVLASRTVGTTIALAQEMEHSPLRQVGWRAYSQNWKSLVLLLVPIVSLVFKQRMHLDTQFCMAVLPCSLHEPLRLPLVMMSVGLLLFFSLLDHALLIALCLMVQRRIRASSTTLRNITLFLRLTVACFVLSGAFVLVNHWHYVLSDFNPRVDINGHSVELKYLSYSLIDPLITNAIYLASNTLVLKTSTCTVYDEQTDKCLMVSQDYGSLPFILFVVGIATLPYLVLIGCAIRCAAYIPEKPKREST